MGVAAAYAPFRSARATSKKHRAGSPQKAAQWPRAAVGSLGASKERMQPAVKFVGDVQPLTGGYTVFCFYHIVSAVIPALACTGMTKNALSESADRL